MFDFQQDVYKRQEYVDDDVLRLIQTHMKTVLDTEKMIQEMNAASKNQTQYLLLRCV